jgi:hypothetical protein
MGRRCSFDGCGRPSYGWGLCQAHYQQARAGKELRPVGYYKRGRGRGGPTSCVFPRCGRLVHAHGYCQGHDAQMRRGKELRPLRVITGSHVDVNGYRIVPGRRFEHRVVMEEMIGRPLLPDESVHHKNGERADNRPENLELWSSWQPSGQRVVDKLEWAHELIQRYE